MPTQIAHALAARFVELREREKVIEEELTAYKELVDLSPCPMVLASKDGLVIYVNKSYCEMLGVGMEDVVVNGWQAFVAKHDLARVKAVWDQAISSGKDEVVSHVVFDTPAKGEMTVYWKARMLRANGYAIAIYHPGCKFLETESGRSMLTRCSFYGA